VTDRDGPVQPGPPAEPGPGLPGVTDQPGAGERPGKPGQRRTGPRPGVPGQPSVAGQPRVASLPGLPDLPGPLRPAGAPAAPSPPDLPGKSDLPRKPELPGKADVPGPELPAEADLPGKAGPAGLPSLHDPPTPLATTAPVSPAPRPGGTPPGGTPPGSEPAGAGAAIAEPPGSAAAAPGLDLDRLAGLVSARMAEPEIPSAEQAVLLREKAPELYDLWLRIAQDKAETDNYVHRAPYEVPERLAHSGRPRALGAMIVVLAFCGYLASLGGPGPYIGGVIALLDLLIMLMLFFGLRPEHLTETSRARKRRLSRSRARPGYPVTYIFA
jgi:hypothetical protein